MDAAEILEVDDMQISDVRAECFRGNSLPTRELFVERTKNVFGFSGMLQFQRGIVVSELT